MWIDSLTETLEKHNQFLLDKEMLILEKNREEEETKLTSKSDTSSGMLNRYELIRSFNRVDRLYP